MKYLIFVLSLFSLMVQADGNHFDAADHHTHPLFQAMGFVQLDEPQLTPEEAIELSPVIVRGRIISVTPGRTIQHVNGYSSPNRTALFKMKVSKVLKGDVGKFVYFEYLTGAMPAEYLNARKYKKDILVLLREPGWPDDRYTFTNSENGLMHKVKTLYNLTSMRGLIIENPQSEGGLDYPLVGGDPEYLGDSFDALEKEIPALAEGHGFDLSLD